MAITITEIGFMIV